MSITVFKTSPQQLLDKIKIAIDDGKVETWSYDSDGHFTHTPAQWKYKAWLTPVVGSDTLQFGLIRRSDETMTKLIYGVYHGRFSEMLLTHFDSEFSSLASTAFGSAIDNIS